MRQVVWHSNGLDKSGKPGSDSGSGALNVPPSRVAQGVRAAGQGRRAEGGRPLCRSLARGRVHAVSSSGG